MMRSRPHHYAIRIEADDIDALGHVNNAIYLRWVQAAVVDHWEVLAPPEVAAHRWSRCGTTSPIAGPPSWPMR